MRFLVVLAADSGDAFVPAEGRQVCTRTQSIPHLVQGDSFDQREYTGAVKPPVRRIGNHLSGHKETTVPDR